MVILMVRSMRMMTIICRQEALEDDGSMTRPPSGKGPLSLQLEIRLEIKSETKLEVRFVIKLEIRD